MRTDPTKRRRRRCAAATGVVVAYRRVSSDEQVESGAGLAAQTAAIEAEAARRGWVLHWAQDDGVSGAVTPTSRTGLRGALEMLEAGAASVLVVSRLDRLSRDLEDFAGLLKRAKQQGWALVCLDLGVDTTTAVGEMVASIIASTAQHERRIIGERTREALQARRAQGRRLGRPSRLTATAKTRVSEMWAKGITLAATVDVLNAEGIATPTGTGVWTFSTVQRARRTIELDEYASAARGVADAAS
jgi:DNA invertase Pin-like site-specific DNA recombinase